MKLQPEFTDGQVVTNLDRGAAARLDVGDQAVNGNSQARRVGLTSRGDTFLKNSIVFIALRRVFLIAPRGILDLALEFALLTKEASTNTSILPALQSVLLKHASTGPVDILFRVNGEPMKHAVHQ